MLSKKEKQKLLQEHWDSKKTVGSFVWAIQRWCEDYKSMRDGIIALSHAIQDMTGENIPASTLLKYAHRIYPSPQLTTVIPTLCTILAKENGDETQPK